MNKFAFPVAALTALSLAIVGPAVAEEPEFLMELGTVAPKGSPDSLPKEIQTTITTVDPDIVAWGRSQVRKIEPVLLKNLGNYGYEIYDPSAEEVAPFKAKQKGIPDRIAKEVGPAGVALLKEIRAQM